MRGREHPRARRTRAVCGEGGHREGDNFVAANGGIYNANGDFIGWQPPSSSTTSPTIPPSSNAINNQPTTVDSPSPSALASYNTPMPQHDVAVASGDQNLQASSERAGESPASFFDVFKECNNDCMSCNSISFSNVFSCCKCS